MPRWNGKCARMYLIMDFPPPPPSHPSVAAADEKDIEKL